jgi:hypothetical protein
MPWTFRQDFDDVAGEPVAARTLQVDQESVSRNRQRDVDGAATVVADAIAAGADGLNRQLHRLAATALI